MQGDSRAALGLGAFYGDARGVTVGGARFSVVTHARERVLDEHAHEAAYFCLLLDGEYEETSDGVTLRYRPLTIAYHPPACPHHDRIGSVGARFFIVELSGVLFELAGPAALPARVSELAGGPAVWLAWRLYEECFPEPRSPEVVESLLYELCALASTMRADEPAEPPWLGAAAGWAAKHFRAGISVAAVAAQVGVHPFHLTRTFRRFRKRSFGEHVQRLRVQYACECLRERTASLAQIALDAGFADQAHFTHACRRVTGETPGKLRARLREAAATPIPF